MSCFFRRCGVKRRPDFAIVHRMNNTPTVVSVINLKGGVGKTTVTALLARYAAEHWGLDVLAVDLDPQANLSQALMAYNDYKHFMVEKQPSIVELFSGFAPATHQKPSPHPLDPASVIQSVNIRSWGKGALEVIPSRFDFSDNLIHSMGKDGMNKKALAEFIASHMQDKDLILIDCAPTESILTIASYHASRYVLIPVKTEFFSTIGFPLMKESLDTFRKENPGNTIDVCGIIVHNTKTSGSAQSKDGWDSWKDIEEQANEYGWDVLDNTMDHSDGYPKLARDPATTWPGNAETEWPKIAKEILAKIGLSKKEAEQ